MNVLTSESPDWQWALFMSREKRAMADWERRLKIEAALAGDRVEAALHGEMQAIYARSARRHEARWRKGAKQWRKGIPAEKKAKAA